MVETAFFTSNNREKYPNEGKLDICKKCITMHIDNWDPSTYLWILEEVDVPYIPQEWNDILTKQMAKGAEITSSSIIGRYMSKMKLRQNKNYRWADSEMLQNINSAKIEQTMRENGYDNAQIQEALTKNMVIAPEKPDYLINQSSNPEPIVEQEKEDNTFLNDLTEEDRTYLRLKWGKTYRPEEWVQLEQLYEEMTQSYDISAAGDVNTLKLACKTSLKANQLLDIGDIEGAQKATKMYDSLMKQGKWTAAQNKSSDTQDFSSIGELVALCEKEGFIPRYYIDTPNDKVDKVILDLQNYTRDLINGESNLNNMLDNALKAIERDRINESIIDTDDTDEAFEESLFAEQNEELKVEDYQEFNEFEEKDEIQDEAFYASLKDDY